MSSQLHILPLIFRSHLSAVGIVEKCFWLSIILLFLSTVDEVDDDDLDEFLDEEEPEDDEQDGVLMSFWNPSLECAVPKRRKVEVRVAECSG